MMVWGQIAAAVGSMAMGAMEQSRLQSAQKRAVGKALKLSREQGANVERLAPELKALYGQQLTDVNTGFDRARGAVVLGGRQAVSDTRSEYARMNADTLQNTTSRGLANSTVLSSLLAGNGYAFSRAMAANRAQVAAATGQLDLSRGQANAGLRGAYGNTLMALANARNSVLGDRMSIYTGQDIQGGSAGAIGGAMGTLGKAFDTIDWGKMFGSKGGGLGGQTINTKVDAGPVGGSA